jgi:NAD(P)-dependent dehydrogenase (short-subunit alcohol dehydrogenase family)
VDLRALELDVASEDSADAAIAKIVNDNGRLDVVVHNAGHMTFGPAESFTPEQFAELYDVNVLGTQRVNRAALPQLRKQGKGLLVWVSSSSARGGTPPYLAPYFAAKAAMDSVAVSYASELSRWGIETTIVVPGSFTKGTNHFEHSGKPADVARAEEYANGPTSDIADVALKNLAAIAPPDADPGEVAREIARVVNLPFGKRPFRVYIDPADDGAEVVNRVGDRVRAEFLRRIELGDLLTPRGV